MHLPFLGYHAWHLVVHCQSHGSMSGCWKQSFWASFCLITLRQIWWLSLFLSNEGSSIVCVCLTCYFTWYQRQTLFPEKLSVYISIVFSPQIIPINLDSLQCTFAISCVYFHIICFHVLDFINNCLLDNIYTIGFGMICLIHCQKKMRIKTWRALSRKTDLTVKLMNPYSWTEVSERSELTISQSSL